MKTSPGRTHVLAMIDQSTQRRWMTCVGVSLIFIVGLVGSVLLRSHRGAYSTPGERDVESAVRSIFGALADDDIERVWSSLSQDTRRSFASKHASVVEFVNGTRNNAQPDDIVSRHTIRAFESEYGMALADVAASTPESLWVHRIRRFIAQGASSPEPFGDFEIRKLETDGTRARVDCRLADGHSQGIFLVRDDGEWCLVDFVPYLSASAWSRPAKDPMSITTSR